MIPSYGKIYNLGRAEVAPILEGEVLLQEKIDGSQFSFMKDEAGEVHFRSRSVEVHANEGGMFAKGVAAILERKDRMVPGYVYRGEYLQKPKHNVLAYDRVPKGHTILWEIHYDPFPGRNFDGTTPKPAYLPHEALEQWAQDMDLEVVPRVEMKQVTLDGIREALDVVSILGGAKREGIVIKNYSLLDRHTGLPLMAKYVADHFKEVKDKDWKERNPGKKDILEELIDRYRSEARWHKAVQHLREAGNLTETPADIGNLIREAQRDIQEECSTEIKDRLYHWFWRQAARSLVGGLPEWYKEQLARNASEPMRVESVLAASQPQVATQA